MDIDNVAVRIMDISLCLCSASEVDVLYVATNSMCWRRHLQLRVKCCCIWWRSSQFVRDYTPRKWHFQHVSELLSEELVRCVQFFSPISFTLYLLICSTNCHWLNRWDNLSALRSPQKFNKFLLKFRTKLQNFSIVNGEFIQLALVRSYQCTL